MGVKGVLVFYLSNSLYQTHTIHIASSAVSGSHHHNRVSDYDDFDANDK